MTTQTLVERIERLADLVQEPFCSAGLRSEILADVMELQRCSKSVVEKSFIMHDEHQQEVVVVHPAALVNLSAILAKTGVET